MNSISVDTVDPFGSNRSVIDSIKSDFVSNAYEMSVFHLNSNYSKWRTAGVIIAALNIMFNIYFGQYFELLLYIVHLPSGYYAVLGETFIWQ